MKNTFLMLSLAATVFCSCSNDEVLVETTRATNTIETSNLEFSNSETSIDGTSRLKQMVGPTTIPFNRIGTFFATVNSSGERTVEWFIDDRLFETDNLSPTPGNFTSLSIIPKNDGFRVGQKVKVSARQKGLSRTISVTFTVTAAI